MPLVSSREVIQIIRRTLNHVDSRLVSHGERVAYMVLKMLDTEGVNDARMLRDACMATMLHDVGAYKTEEIDQMVVFESREVWQHAIYGYLFLKKLSPLRELAPAILYHHLDYARLRQIDTPQKELAQLINLADRVDTYLLNRRCPPPEDELNTHKNRRFSPEALALFYRMQRENPQIYAMLEDGSFTAELERRMAAALFTEEEINGYLRMVVSAIDFRSYHTVTHTITTESISAALAARMGLTAEECYKVKYGSLLHDLGKIAIPVEILEYPGKLSPEDMSIMKTHVVITGEILGESADEEMLRIAVRHHEKLDGSGYPLGLTGDVLTRGERIVAVADIMSALSGTRSYKDAFDKEHIRSILRQQKEAGLLCPVTVDTMLEHYDSIMEEVRVRCAPILNAYDSIQREYTELELSCRSMAR